MGLVEGNAAGFAGGDEDDVGAGLSQGALDGGGIGPVGGVGGGQGGDLEAAAGGFGEQGGPGEGFGAGDPNPGAGQVHGA